MKRYPLDLKQQVRTLRATGKTYSEIRNQLSIQLAKSTLSDWCKNVQLPVEYQSSIDSLNKRNLGKARTIGMAMNAMKRKEFFERVSKTNTAIAKKISDRDFSKMALAMLCLGEASKSKSKSTFSLGNSDPRIIILFLELLKHNFVFKIEKVRCTVQCRADQNTTELENYWQQITNIPKENFYKTRIDPRTIGKPTLRSDYKGVLKVDYFSTKIQLDLESLADLTYNQILLGR